MLRSKFIQWLGDALISRASNIPPDFIIGNSATPYLRRWWLIPRNRFFNIYLHQFMRSDDDRDLHDHPWWNVSILLRGEYVEATSGIGSDDFNYELLSAGSIKCRSAAFLHRIILTRGECWTLFITGPRIREWGFKCPQGWWHWKEFTAPNNKGEVRRGCE